MTFVKAYSSCSEYLRLALQVYTQKRGVDVQADIARTKYKLCQVLHEVGRIKEADKLKTEAQQLRFELEGKLAGEDEPEEAYDNLVAYFYR